MIETFGTPEALADAAASAVVEALSAAIAGGGRGRLVVTGGRSPGLVYDQLSQTVLDWGRVDVTLSDERFVPEDHPDSNAGLVNQRLRVGLAQRSIFVPLYSPAASADEAARAAEVTVRALLPFDVVHLGMGEDGHVASLIPGSPVLDAGMDPAGERILIGVPEGTGSPPLARITLSLPALLQARSILLTVAGEAKRAILRDAAAGADYPVAALLRQDAVPIRIIWSP